MSAQVLLSLAVGFAIYGLLSGVVRKSLLTAPMVFLFWGLLIGPLGFGWVDMHLEAKSFHLLAEIALLLILFSDASRIDLRLIVREHLLPVRLLLIGMPLVVVAGMLAGLGLMPWLSLWEAAALAAILAPTDAALSQPILANKAVPRVIRHSVNMESGANDGLALPAVLVFIYFANAAVAPEAYGFWTTLAVKQVLIGPAVGLALGVLGGKALSLAKKRGWVLSAMEPLALLGMGVAAFAGAEVLEGNGFLAAFCAGLAVGHVARQVYGSLDRFVAVEGDLLAYLTFMLFGAIMVPVVVEGFDWRFFVYAVLSLTAVRMLPAYLSLIGSAQSLWTKTLLGWFGPRGVASILFGLLLLGGGEVPGQEDVRLDPALIQVVILTVFLSILLHGFSASLLARRYQGRQAHGD